MDATEAIMRAVAEREAAGEARPQPKATNAYAKLRRGLTEDYWSPRRRAERRKYVETRYGSTDGRDAGSMRF